uniref:MurR/RpiR family transcriptional regulator n=1 Tax=Bifidobacterium pullorum TaxID=78448 RepID=UPI003AB1B041
LRKAVSLITRARLIDIIGVENSMVPATDLFTKLNYLGLTCRLNADAYMQQIGAGHLEPDDVVVAFSHSGRSADTIKALRLAKSRDAHTIVITNTPDAPIGNWADVQLLAGQEDRKIYGSAIFSRTAHIAMVDILYMAVILSDYGRFSTELDRSGRYIQDRGFGA